MRTSAAQGREQIRAEQSGQRQRQGTADRLGDQRAPRPPHSALPRTATAPASSSRSRVGEPGRRPHGRSHQGLSVRVVRPRPGPRAPPPARRWWTGRCPPPAPRPSAADRQAAPTRRQRQTVRGNSGELSVRRRGRAISRSQPTVSDGQRQRGDRGDGELGGEQSQRGAGHGAAVRRQGGVAEFLAVGERAEQSRAEAAAAGSSAARRPAGGLRCVTDSGQEYGQQART